MESIVSALANGKSIEVVTGMIKQEMDNRLAKVIDQGTEYVANNLVVGCCPSEEK